MTQAQRVAIVTGGGQGIGKAIVLRLLQDGLAVVVAEIDAVAGAETVEELQALGPVHFIRTDVAAAADVQQLVADTVARFGGLDVLVNNAGIGITKPLLALTLAEWHRVLDVNLTSIFLGAQAAAPHLQARRGSMINIASTRALMSEADTEAYSASKGGVVALTHALAISLGPAVRVNCISPGWIAVDAWQQRARRNTPELSAADHAQHPAGRVGMPEDIAAMVAFLATPSNTFITGQNFVIDGGMTKKMIYVE